MDTNRKIIATTIKKRRKEYGYTQKEMAERLCVNLKTYQKIENLEKEDPVSFNLVLKAMFFLKIGVELKGLTISEMIQRVQEEEGEAFSIGFD